MVLKLLPKIAKLLQGSNWQCKGFGKNPQAFNGPLGFSFFEWLDDASRSARATP
jgi:hypothetical protein